MILILKSSLKKISGALVILIVLFSQCLFDVAYSATTNVGANDWLETIDPDLKRLREEIQERQSQIQDLTKQQKVYEDGLALKRREVGSLKNQLAIIDDSINQLTLQTEKLNLEISKTKLELESNDIEIRNKEKEIDSQLIKLGGIVVSLDKKERRRSNSDLIALSGGLSDWLQSISHLKRLEKGLSEELGKLEVLKNDLVEKANLLESRKTQLENLQARLEASQDRMEREMDYKNQLLDETKNQEGTYQKLLAAAKAEQNKINSDIQDLEVQSRKILIQKKGEVPNDTGFIWPVPSRVVSAYFHDPDYPFRNIFEHPAIDIARTPQGTPIRAIKSGYVARVKFDGNSNYAYIMIVHKDGVSSVYGHVSKSYVKEDSFVAQGEVIGLSGGAPGGVGSGRLTTGPHLHLEIRLNGIPVDPLQYLP